jgi:hypothetical protein
MMLSNGNLGIGTGSPAFRLDISGSTRTIGTLTVSQTATNTVAVPITTASTGVALHAINSALSNGVGFQITALSTGKSLTTNNLANFRYTHSNDASPCNLIGIGFWGNDDLLAVQAGGNVGIGLTNPAYKLHVSGQIYATGDIVAFSDSRYKQTLQTITNPLDKIQQLTGYTYNMTTPTDEQDTTKVTPRYTGLLAQDLEKVLPEAVHKDPEGKMSVAYGNLAGLFVESIKELTKENKQLKERLDKLEEVLQHIK